VAIYGCITAKEKIAMMQLILLWQRKGPRLVKCMFDEWWLWERRWWMETDVLFSSIDECGYSMWRNGERKKSECTWGHAEAEEEFAAGEM
jgi:hypothetical protein